jgi:hypothetical protein
VLAQLIGRPRWYRDVSAWSSRAGGPRLSNPGIVAKRGNRRRGYSPSASMYMSISCVAGYHRACARHASRSITSSAGRTGNVFSYLFTRDVVQFVGVNVGNGSEAFERRVRAECVGAVAAEAVAADGSAAASPGSQPRRPHHEQLPNGGIFSVNSSGSISSVSGGFLRSGRSIYHDGTCRV